MTEEVDETIAGREATDAELSTSARRLIAKISPQWQYETTYSHGPLTNMRVADCVMITLRSPTGEGVLAAFLDGKFWTGFTWQWCVECIGPGFAHPADVPEARGYRELCTLVSAT